ncbi:MAG TPA: hypothetical protein VFG83_17940 [Kofleriaceae bacterium]|nr:hypothetical protein [Kofleriaceae bacterium]
MATAEDKVNALGIVTIGIVSAMLVWVSVVALQAYYQNTYGEEEAKKNAENKSAAYLSLRATQAADLDEYVWADRQKGLVKLPIERAMELVVHDLQAGSPSVVPAVGAQDTPTVPAVFGRPPDGVKMPGLGTTPLAPEGGAAAAGTAAATGAENPATGATAPATGAEKPAAGSTAKPAKKPAAGAAKKPAAGATAKPARKPAAGATAKPARKPATRGATAGE